ncbi:hypothetical protein C2G38_2182717, partial [Gigaspora rosea]
MSENKYCSSCQATQTVKFRSLGADKWKEIVSRGLEKPTWKKGTILCNKCYMDLVENPLRRGNKRVKGIDQAENAGNEAGTSNEKIELSEAIRLLAKFFYEREHVKKEDTIYTFEELQELLVKDEPNLKYFLEQLYLAARPSTRTEQTMD